MGSTLAPLLTVPAAYTLAGAECHLDDALIVLAELVTSSGATAQQIAVAAEALGLKTRLDTILCAASKSGGVKVAEDLDDTDVGDIVEDEEDELSDARSFERDGVTFEPLLCAQIRRAMVNVSTSLVSSDDYLSAVELLKSLAPHDTEYHTWVLAGAKYGPYMNIVEDAMKACQLPLDDDDKQWQLSLYGMADNDYADDPLPLPLLPPSPLRRGDHPDELTFDQEHYIPLPLDILPPAVRPRRLVPVRMAARDDCGGASSSFLVFEDVPHATDGIFELYNRVMRENACVRQYGQRVGAPLTVCKASLNKRPGTPYFPYVRMVATLCGIGARDVQAHWARRRGTRVSNTKQGKKKQVGIERDKDARARAASAAATRARLIQ